MINKKGFAVHTIILILAILIGLGTFSYHYSLNENPVSGDYIGNVQLDIIRNFQNAESSLFYIDQSAKYSVQQALQQMADEGVLYEAECGSFDGISALAAIAKKGDDFDLKECSLDDKSLNENFLRYFNESFRNYIGNYPDAYIPDSYEYEIKESGI